MSAVVPSEDRATEFPKKSPPAPALLVRVAVGDEVVVHELSEEAWKMYAAPIAPLAPVAPTSAVVPSEDRATENPKSSDAPAPLLLRVAAGADVVVHELSEEAWNTRTYSAPAPLPPSAPTAAVVPSAERATENPRASFAMPLPFVRVAVGRRHRRPRALRGGVVDVGGALPGVGARGTNQRRRPVRGEGNRTPKIVGAGAAAVGQGGGGRRSRRPRALRGGVEDVDGTVAAYQRRRPVGGEGDRAPETVGAEPPLLVSVAVGVEVVDHEPSEEAWKM